MRQLRSCRVSLPLALVAVLGSARAEAQLTTFASGSVVIPMDGCYDRPNNMSDANVDAVIAPATRAQLGCEASSTKDDGIMLAYGLVVRLVSAGVPVSWVIKPAKTGFQEVDLAITPGSLVKKLDYSTGAITTPYAAVASVQYRGSVFVIDAADVAAARVVMGLYPEFRFVDLHRVDAAFAAVVQRRITSLGKVAILDVSSSADFTMGTTTTHTNALTDVGMAWGEGVWWNVITPAQLRAGVLASGNYSLLWVPPFASFTAANQAANVAAIEAFLERAGTPGYVVFQDTAIWGMEGVASGLAPAWSPASKGHAPNRLLIDGLPGTYGNNAATELARSDDYSDPFAQIGGEPWQAVGGASKAEWQPSGGAGAYNPGVFKVIYSYHTTTASLRYWEVASWRFYKGDPSKGKILYTGGDFLRLNTMSPYRVLLNSIFAAPSAIISVVDVSEVTRASPTVDDVGGVATLYQGTYEVLTPAAAVTTYTGTASADAMRFPSTRGHLRGIDTAQVGAAQDYDLVTSIFDADTWLAALATPLSSRVVFTNVATGSRPSRVAFTTSSASTLAGSLSRPSPATAFTSAEASLLIQRVLAGDKVSSSWRARLGGVDRSGPVVVGASRVAGGARPTILYFGAADGMLHAVCANDAVAVSPCTTPGQELWAFLPRVELGKLWQNRQRIDGSPAAVDVFEDFDGNGTNEWKTLVVFQTGNPQGPTAAYALDVTAPGSPEILWERALDGTGLAAAVGPVGSSAGRSHQGFFLINRGTQAPGFEVVAIDLVSGATTWTASRTFSLPGNDQVLLASGIPDGLAAVDLDDVGGITHVIVPTLAGELYVFDAGGADAATATARMRFSASYHPLGAGPAVWRAPDNSLHAVVVSGGYADPLVTNWSPATVDQYLVSVALDHLSTMVVGDGATQLAPVPGVDYRVNLGAGQRAYGAATVIGEEIFVTTQLAPVDPNEAIWGSTSGAAQLHHVSVDGTVHATTSVGGGVTSVSAHAGQVYLAGETQLQRVTPDQMVEAGISSELRFDLKKVRRLWLKLQ